MQQINHIKPKALALKATYCKKVRLQRVHFKLGLKLIISFPFFHNLHHLVCNIFFLIGGRDHKSLRTYVYIMLMSRSLLPLGLHILYRY